MGLIAQPVSGSLVRSFLGARKSPNYTFNYSILNSVRDNFVKHCNSDPDETGHRKRRADADTESNDNAKPEVETEMKSETAPVENDYCSFNKSVSKCTIRNTCIYHYNFSMEWNFGDTGTFY